MIPLFGITQKNRSCFKETTYMAGLRHKRILCSPLGSLVSISSFANFGSILLPDCKKKGRTLVLCLSSFWGEAHKDINQDWLTWCFPTGMNCRKLEIKNIIHCQTQLARFEKNKKTRARWPAVPNRQPEFLCDVVYGFFGSRVLLRSAGLCIARYVWSLLSMYVSYMPKKIRIGVKPNKLPCGAPHAENNSNSPWIESGYSASEVWFICKKRGWLLFRTTLGRRRDNHLIGHGGGFQNWRVCEHSVCVIWLFYLDI